MFEKEFYEASLIEVTEFILTDSIAASVPMGSFGFDEIFGGEE